MSRETSGQHELLAYLIKIKSGLDTALMLLMNASSINDGAYIESALQVLDGLWPLLRAAMRLDREVTVAVDGAVRTASDWVRNPRSTTALQDARQLLLSVSEPLKRRVLQMDGGSSLHPLQVDGVGQRSMVPTTSSSADMRTQPGL